MKIKKSIKLLSGLLAVILVAGTLAGCGGKNAAEQSTAGVSSGTAAQSTGAEANAAQSGGEEKTLVAVMWGEQARWDAQKKVNDAFTQKYPNLKIDLQTLPNDTYWTKLQTMIAGGTPPDIAFMQEMLTPTYQAKGIMADLTDYMGKDTSFKKDCMPEGMYGPFTVDGKLYAMPTMTFVNVLFYNKDIFDKAGIPYPDENYTWDTLRETAKQLTKDTNGDGKIDQYGFSFGAWPNFIFPYIWANGGEFIKDDRKTSVLNSAENVQTFQYLHDLIWKDKVTPSAAANKSNAFDFANGNIAMFDLGSWNVAVYDDKKINYGITLTPKAPNGGRVVNTFPNGWFIVNQSENKEDAWKYLAFNVSEEGQKVAAEGKVGMPANTQIAKSDAYLKSSTTPGVDLGVTLKSAEISRGAYTTSNWSEIESKIWPEFDLIWTKENADVKAVLDSVQIKLQAKVNEAK